MRIYSESPEETYILLTGFGQMREWVGDRVIRSLAAHGFTIRKKDWEYTISVHRDEILFDKLNLVRPRIQNMADLAARHRDQLVVDLLIGGFQNLCYDGQYFFDTDHRTQRRSPVEPYEQQLTPESYEAAYAAMQSLGRKGEPLVPPTWWYTAASGKGSGNCEGGRTGSETRTSTGSAGRWCSLVSKRPPLGSFSICHVLKPSVVQIVRIWVCGT